MRHLIPVQAIPLDAYDDQRFLAAGITDLLIKPFSRSDLLDRLEHLIGSAANV
jgi:CheY-like chemotaxis protein